MLQDAVAEPGLRGEQEACRGQRQGQEGDDHVTEGQEIRVEEVLQDTALDMEEGQGNVRSAEGTQGQGSPPGLAMNSEPAGQHEDQGPTSAALSSKRQGWSRKGHGWTCREPSRTMSSSRDRGLRGQEWTEKMRPPTTSESL